MAESGKMGMFAWVLGEEKTAMWISSGEVVGNGFECSGTCRIWYGWT